VLCAISTSAAAQIKVDGVPCEVCVSRQVVSQCAQDAHEADACRQDVRRALMRVELADANAREHKAALDKANAELEQYRAKTPPTTAFVYGFGAGVGATLLTITIIVLTR